MNLQGYTRETAQKRQNAKANELKLPKLKVTVKYKQYVSFTPAREIFPNIIFAASMYNSESIAL